MLNRGRKKNAIDKCERAVAKYNRTVEKVQRLAGELHALREESSKITVAECQAYLSALASSPIQLQRSVHEFGVEYARFSDLIVDFKREFAGHYVVGGTVMGAGAALGIGLAAFAPTVAMTAATTFGVASTGTAISALSGVAATNAALAWLGGGALVAGGGGIAGGTALLALTGPVGWTIGGLGLVTGSVSVSWRNAKAAEKAALAAAQAETGTALLEDTAVKIGHLVGRTGEHVKRVRHLLARLRASAPINYGDFREEDKLTLTALVSSLQSLSRLQKTNVS